MKKPSKEELAAFAVEIGWMDFDVEAFIDHYTANGWRVGKVPMKDWKATVRNWRRMRRDYGYGARRQQPHAPLTTWQQRNRRINELNARKAVLYRQPPSRERDRELERIQTELHKL